ncbi:MAG: hypothetical protein QM783_20110 [Phycisphaerales bacterium]
MKTVRTFFAVLAGLLACGASLTQACGQVTKPEPVKPRAIRVAVLHVGPDNESGGGESSTNATGLPAEVEAYAQAADELKAAEADVVVLRINSYGGLNAAHGWLSLMEKSYRPRFRVVSWVKEAVGEAGLVAVAAPELFMATGAELGGTRTPSQGTPKDSVQADWLNQGARAATIGGRPLPAVRAMQSMAPLSMTVVDGKQRFFQDERGERVLNPASSVMLLNATSAIECGISLGTADDRAGLAKAMKLEEVEWVGADVDRRLQERLIARCAKTDPSKPTRVAVLNIGLNEASRSRLKRPATFSDGLPLSEYADAAAELKLAGAEVVVLRINEGSACGTEAFIDLIDKSFLPRFRTVGWVAEAVNESGVTALAIPEVCMTPDGYWGNTTCHVWNHKTCTALAARATSVGKRSLELAQGFMYSGPLSTSVVDGKRVYKSDALGDVVLSRTGGVSLNAQLAEASGVSIGTAATPEDLVRVLGLSRVQWIGTEVDGRVQARCERAARDLERVRDLLFAARMANKSLTVIESEEQRAKERSKRDAAWSEVQELRRAWPELAARWPRDGR